MRAKKIIKLICIVGCLLCVPTNGNAQFWKKVTKRLQNKAENKALQKIDKKADETMENALKKKKKKAKDVDAVISYIFKGSVTVEVTNEKDEKAVFNLLFSEEKEITCMEMNVDNSSQVYNVITPSKIISFINAGGMKIKKENSASLEYDNSDKMPKGNEGLVKTGNTKTILGYKCSEYVYKNDEGYASVWLTESFPIASNYAPLLGMTNETSIKGFVLELKFESKTGEKASIEVIKIEKDKKTVIDTRSYKSMF